MTPKVPYFSESVLSELRQRIPENIHRYREEGFYDLRYEPGWSIELDCKIDFDLFQELNGSERSAEADLKNSQLIFRALAGLTPSAANEERIWARLSHVEGFAYSKFRWLTLDNTNDQLLKSINKHLFGATQTGIRDDNALSRLWWTAFIAAQCYPESPETALRLLWRRADVRSNFVERIWMSSRRKLAGRIIHSMENDLRVLESEASFRIFMKTINLRGGGIVFENLSTGGIDDFLKKCADNIGKETP